MESVTFNLAARLLWVIFWVPLTYLADYIKTVNGLLQPSSRVTLIQQEGHFNWTAGLKVRKSYA